MLQLNLSPFPRLPSAEDSRSPEAGSEGFVDDEVALALVAGSAIHRPVQPALSQLALAAEDTDFAGWCLSPAPAITRTVAPAAFAPRPAPPALSEPGLGEPHRGSHRWWLAGLAGAMSTLLFSSLLLFLSARVAPHAGKTILAGVPVKPLAETPPPRTEPGEPSPQLTEISP